LRLSFGREVQRFFRPIGRCLTIGQISIGEITLQQETQSPQLAAIGTWTKRSHGAGQRQGAAARALPERMPGGGIQLGTFLFEPKEQGQIGATASAARARIQLSFADRTTHRGSSSVFDIEEHVGEVIAGLMSALGVSIRERLAQIAHQALEFLAVFRGHRCEQSLGFLQ
jgi:hypothetical protein